MSEDRLILLLARGELSARLQDEARALLAGPLNWDVILERVTAEEVYPLFTRNLREIVSKEQGAGSGEPEVGDQKSEVKGQRSVISGRQSSVTGPWTNSREQRAGS